MRTYTDQTILLNEVAADGASVAGSGLVIDFTHIEAQVAMTGFTGVIKFVGSTADTAPAFGSAASATNPWSYIKSIDLIDGSAINGGTGITGVATTSVTNLEVNVNALKWVGAIISGFSAGTITLKIKGVSVSGS